MNILTQMYLIGTGSEQDADRIKLAKVCARRVLLFSNVIYLFFICSLSKCNVMSINVKFKVTLQEQVQYRGTLQY